MTRPASRAQQTRNTAEESARRLIAQADAQATPADRVAFLSGCIYQAAEDAAGPVDNHRRLFDLTVIRAFALALTAAPQPAPQED